MRKVTIAIAAAGAFWLAGCGDGACCQNGTLSSDATTPPVHEAGNLDPTAVITGLPATATVGESLQAQSDQSSDDKGIVTYQWTLDGTPVDQPTFTFDHAGTHTVCLSVTDTDGAQDQTCKTIVVSDPVAATKPPVAVITLTGEDSLTPGTYHTFSCAESYDRDSIGESDPKAAIRSCVWTIQSYRQDGSLGRRCANNDSFKTQTDEICGYAYTIKATLTVTDDEGETATTTKTYTIIH